MLLAGVALVVAGCGGSGGGGGSATDQIRQVITTVSTLKSNAACNNDFTDQGRQEFFQTDSVASGKKDCAAAVGKEHITTSELMFGKISVSGSTGTALVTVKSRTAKIGLVKQGGWKVNSISAVTGATSASTSTSASGTGSTGTTLTTSSPTTPTTTSGTVSPAQNAETKAAALCLQGHATSVKGDQQFAKPAVVAHLRSGNVIALVLYGPAGGAIQGEQAIRRSHPNLSAYSSPNGKILIFYAHKPNKTDFDIGNSCQLKASAAG